VFPFLYKRKREETRERSEKEKLVLECLIACELANLYCFNLLSILFSLLWRKRKQKGKKKVRILSSFHFTSTK
jgi:hypothetical protein